MISRAGLRAVRAAPAQQLVARRFASNTPKKASQGGFAEFGPFLKREFVCQRSVLPNAHWPPSVVLVATTGKSS